MGFFKKTAKNNFLSKLALGFSARKNINQCYENIDYNSTSAVCY